MAVNIKEIEERWERALDQLDANDGKDSLNWLVSQDMIYILDELKEFHRAVEPFATRIHAHSHDCTLGPSCDVCNCGLSAVKKLAKEK